MKFLIDTNIFIPLEPTRLSEVENSTEKAVEFAQLIVLSGHQIYLHPAGRSDLERDLDEQRRELREIMFNKYPLLPDPPPISSSIESVLGYADTKSNDWVDHQLIAALSGNATDFLVTEDRSLRKKVVRLGLESRVTTINEAISIVRDLYDTCPSPPPAVKDIKAHALDETDPIFQSMRKDYPGFDEWLVKCKREHRQTWVIDGKDSNLAAVCTVKQKESRRWGLNGKILKICSFKVSEKSNGFRYGELLLKTIFDYTAKNGYDWIYITVFEKYQVLISLLDDFDFQDVGGKTDIGELVFSKPMSFPREAHESFDPLSFNVRYGPFALKIKGVPAYLVPIKPLYHRLLFPETEKQMEFLPGNRPFGNSIRKAYLSNAQIRTIKPGSNIFFYRSSDMNSVIVIGVVEDTLISSSPTEIARYVGKRTVYAFSDIDKMSQQEVLAILFRQSRILKKPITIKELKENGVVLAAPQSIMTIQEEASEWIQNRITE
jgi:L-amino acid N-acyltransferase YncA